MSMLWHYQCTVLQICAVHPNMLYDYTEGKGGCLKPKGEITACVTLRHSVKGILLCGCFVDCSLCFPLPLCSVYPETAECKPHIQPPSRHLLQGGAQRFLMLISEMPRFL